jgi:hypothetical protein
MRQAPQLLSFVAALALAGCATTTAPPQQTVMVDSFCTSPASQKRIWNPETDTIEHVRDAVTWNSYVDRRCGVPGKKVAS